MKYTEVFILCIAVTKNNESPKIKSLLYCDYIKIGIIIFVLNIIYLS